jgi:hypothetical protein
MMTIFDKNINALKKNNPTLVNKLQQIDSNNLNYEIYQGENDPAQINYINKTTFKPIYNNPLEDIKKKIKEIEKFEKYPILYFFGLGNGIFYKLILSNKKLEKVIVYEPDIEIIYITLNLIDLSQEIEEGKIVLILSQDYHFSQALSVLENWSFRFYLKLYDLNILTSYYASYTEEIFKTNNLNIRAIKQIIIAHGNDATDSLIGIKHHLHNIPKMIKNYKFKHLINKKNSDIAVIVATGPSLTKQLPILKEIQDKVTIISVDASLPILEKHNIKPDIVTVLERVELTSEFFLNTSDEFMKDIIFVIASLAHEKTVNAIKGKKVITMRPFAFNRYFNMPEFGYLGVGMSAANMAYELAYVMDYSMTILIGQDLAYGDKVSHAKGHVLGEDEVKQTENDLYVTKYGGDGVVRTNKIWTWFRNNFEKAIYDARNKMLTFNCTEGGARIEGAKEVPFAEITKKLKQTKKEIKLKLPPKSNIDKNFIKAIKKIEDAIIFGKKNQEKIEKLYIEVAKSWDELVYLNKINQLDKIDFKKLYKLSDKIDKLKNIFNNKKFQKLFLDISQSFIVNYELDLAKIQVKKVNTTEEKEAQIVDWIMNHKEWLFTLAGAIDTIIYNMKEELKYIKKEYKNFKEN